MFGIDPVELARSIRGSVNDLAGSMAPKQRLPEPWNSPSSTWQGALPDPRVALLASARPATTKQPVAQPFQATSASMAGGGNIEEMRAKALALAKAMFGDEGERQLNTTFDVEGGWTGRVGDTPQSAINPVYGGGGQTSAVGSWGPLQFYGPGGQLNNFAAAKGIKNLVEAGRYAVANPVEAVEWALNNYYGNALRAGMDLGLRGPELATYIQRYGQVSVRPERAGEVYRRLYGG